VYILPLRGCRRYLRNLHPKAEAYPNEEAPYFLIVLRSPARVRCPMPARNSKKPVKETTNLLNDSLLDKDAGRERKRSQGQFWQTSGIYVMISYFAAFASVTNFAMLSPFFPAVALEHGLSGAPISIVFLMVPAAQPRYPAATAALLRLLPCPCPLSALLAPARQVPLGNLISSLLAPLFIHRLGNLVVLRYALIIQALVTACFGNIASITSTMPFAIVACLFRFAQGISSGFAEVASTSIMWRSVDQDYIPIAIGGMEASRALGVLIGPVLGAIIYDSLGFAAPFLITACVIAIIGAITFCLNPPPEITSADTGEQSISRVSIKELIVYPAVFATVMAKFQVFVNVSSRPASGLATPTVQRLRKVASLRALRLPARLQPG
jgi:hypothetical protein